MQWQKQRCEASGSPVAASMLTALTEYVLANPALLTRIGSNVRFGDFIPLRLMAAAHFIALGRLAPELALYLPTLGGHADVLHPRFAEVTGSALEENPLIVDDFLSRIPQTNEWGRTQALRLGLDHIDAQTPIALREIGCSAGLNLCIAESQDSKETIASRVGCDIAPIDVMTEEGRRRLSAYVWVDDVARFQRLGAAIATAQRLKPTVVRSGAAAFIGKLLLEPGVTTVVWQSALLPYLDSREHDAVEAALTSLGANASPNARLVHVSWEDLGDTTDPRRAFGLAIRKWVGSASEPTAQLIARGSSHGDVIEMVA
jgi:hypothetical protein